MSVDYVASATEEVKELSADEKLSGVFYRRKDGVEFPFSNPCYVIELDENGMPTRLAFYKDGFQNESYILEDHNRAVYLAAVSQGFEPPRGLLRRDRHLETMGATLDVDSIDATEVNQEINKKLCYAVEVGDDGIGLTVYENGRACTVDLSHEGALALADVLTRRGL